AVEVEDVGDVDPKLSHHRYPGRRRAKIPGFGQLLRERRVKVGCHCLVARQWLEAVAMRESRDRLPAGGGIEGDEVEIDGHPLLRAGRCVVKGIDLLDPDRVITPGPLRLADTHREAVRGVKPVPDIAEVHFQFTGEEELVWRWEDSDGA